MPARRSTAVTFLRIAAGVFVLAAIFHLWRVISPAAGDPSGSFRHAVFGGINLVCAVCLWQEPAGFKYVFGLLVVQQVYSHGGSAWNAWFAHRQIDYVSLFIVALLPVTWVVLWRQRFASMESASIDRA